MTPAFGQALKTWFARNKWPQNVPELWARATGCKTGPWGSQISIAMSGRLEPKPNFFQALGQFNAAVTERNFKGVTDGRLLDRLKDAEPMIHENGEPFTGVDFFRLYVGEAAPYFEQAGRDLTQEDCDLWASELRRLFDQVCREHMCNRAEGWRLVGPAIQKVCPDSADWIRDMLAGLQEPEIDACGRLLDQYRGQTPIIDALTAFCEEDTSGKVRGHRAELDRNVITAPHLFSAPGHGPKSALYARGLTLSG